MRAPAACACAQISLIGLTAPSTLETCVNATIRDRVESAFLTLVARAVLRRHVDDANSGAALACKPCPGHQVRRMFRDRDDDFVAASQVRGAPRRRHQVDAFSRAANEHDLGGVGGVDKTGDRLARSRQVIRGTTGQCVHARRIGVVRRVVLHERVDDRLRSECRRRTVQVGQRTSMDGLSKCREHRRPRCARIAPLCAG